MAQEVTNTCPIITDNVRDDLSMIVDCQWWAATWVHLGSLHFTRVHLGSLGFTRVHFFSWFQVSLHPSIWGCLGLFPHDSGSLGSAWSIRQSIFSPFCQIKSPLGCTWIHFCQKGACYLLGLGSNMVVTSTLVTGSVLASKLAPEDNVILIIVFEDPPLAVALVRPS